MKKILTLCLLFAGFFATAQLPNGATGPNIMAKDINGNFWNLYEILETGRPVVMDVSATWCGPCWSFHNDGVLEELSALHGPEGDGQLMVFFVEGDAATNTDCLYNLPGCNSSTQGDWVTGANYPIFDNAGIGNSYDISYFPTIYLICPDKKVTEVGQVSADAIWAQASACMGTVQDNLLRITNVEPNGFSTELCGSRNPKPVLSLRNLGALDMTSATIDMQWNGTTVQTKTWTGDLKCYQNSTLEFDEYTVDQPGTLSFVITSVNGTANGESTISSIDFVPAPKVVKNQQIQVRYITDANAKDIYWAVMDESGAIIDQGGNMAVGLNGGGQFPDGSPSDPTAYPNLVLVKDTITVPANQCFTFWSVDGRGDGFESPGKYRLYNLNNLTTPFYTSSNFLDAYDRHTFDWETVIGTDETVAVPVLLEVSPNPATDLLKIDFSLATTNKVQLFVSNAIGQTMVSRDLGVQLGGDNTYQLPVSNLSAGMYVLTLKTENGAITRKFVVQ